MSSYRPGDRPTLNEIRVIEHNGRRLLQQWRNKPGGALWEFAWVDICELPKPAIVRELKPRR